MSNIEIYKTADGKTEIDVKLDKETVWLTQKQMSVLFEKDVRTVNEHIKNVYSEGELEKYPTIRKFRIVQNEGGRDVEREINHYNLDVIISVGYRIKSQRGTDFRKWATSKLRGYIVRGYTLNISRLQEKQEKLKELFDPPPIKRIEGEPLL
ncbi:MAG: virulence RhuM family protein [Elusimicrobiota bacterium]